MENFEKIDELKISRGKRVRLVRAMTGLTIAEFASRINLSRGAVLGWENAKVGGLTEKGAEKIVNLAEEFDIACGSIWLMHGIGEPPTFLSNPEPGMIKEDNPPIYSTKPAKSTFPEAIKDEANFFQKKHSDSIAIQIKDDCMLPFFAEGDIVAGIKHYAADIETFIGKRCIVETYDKQILVRKITAKSGKNKFNLAGTNIDSSVKNCFLNDVLLKSATPIIWIRHIQAM